MRPRPLSGPGSGDPKRPSGAQACDQLAVERAAGLDVERLVDRLVADPHRLIIGELDREPVRDLLRAPRLHPSAITPMRLVPTLPFRTGRADTLAVVTADHAGQSVLDVLTQPVVSGQLRDLRSTSAPLGMPLRDRRLVVQAVGPRGGVAANLARDRRRAAAQPPGDLPNADILCPPHCDVLALAECQVSGRHRRWQTWIHAASVAEPPECHRRRHTGFGRRVLGLHATSDRRPEPNAIRSPRHRRPPR